MSNWTHVAAVFRVDGIPSLMPEPGFEEVFGKVIPDYEWSLDKKVRETEEYKAAELANRNAWAEYNEHPERFVPTGSEGSLQMSVWRNPHKSCAAAYTVTVFGDLRDHDSIEEIEEWFRKCCSKAWIRQAVVDIDNEINGHRSIAWEGGEDGLR